MKRIATNSHVAIARGVVCKSIGTEGEIVLCGFATSGFILLAEEVKPFWGPLALIMERPIRWVAQSTFSIYLFHLPTLILIQAVTGYSRAAFLPKLVAFAATIGVCIALSLVTERRKNWWNAPVRRILQNFCPGNGA